MLNVLAEVALLYNYTTTLKSLYACIYRFIFVGEIIEIKPYFVT